MNYFIKIGKRKDGIIISTVEPPILAWYGKYETAAIFEEKEGEEAIRILEGYETLEECLKGHEKYLNMTSEEFKKVEFIG